MKEVLKACISLVPSASTTLYQFKCAFTREYLSVAFNGQKVFLFISCCRYKTIYLFINSILSVSKLMQFRVLNFDATAETVN